MRETKADLIRQMNVLTMENQELQAENKELRKFVNYVRNLKTEEDFLNLKTILEEADKHFNSEENEDEE